MSSDNGEGEGQEEQMWKIVTQQDVQGLEDSFLVLLQEGGKRVRRSRTELEQLAPRLLSAFDAQKSRTASISASSSIASRSRSASSSATTTAGRGSTRMAKQRSRGSYTEENTDSEEEEESEEDEEGDGDEYGSKRKSKSKSKSKKNGKPGKEGTRHSSRDKGNKKVKYSGFGQASDEEEDEDEEMEFNDEVELSEESNGEEDSENELIIEEGGKLDKGKGKEVLEISSDEGEGEREEMDQDYEEEEGEGDGGKDQSKREYSINESRPQDMHYQLCAKEQCAKARGPVLKQEYERKVEYRKTKKGGRKKKQDDDYLDTDSEWEKDEGKGAWMECETCVSAYHFGCLQPPIQKSFKAKLDAEHSKSGGGGGKKRPHVELDINKVFKVKKCNACEKPKGATCFECEKSGKRVTEFEKQHHEGQDGDVKMNGVETPSDEIAPGLMFRCQTCHRSAHYGCLERAEFDDAETTWLNHTLSYYEGGICHDCHLYDKVKAVKLDVILGWKEAELPEGAKPPKGEKIKDKKTGKEFVLPNAKDSMFPALYLVKWEDRSYRDVGWVKHSWLSARYQSKLSTFLSKGSRVSFEPTKEELGEEVGDLEPDAQEAALAQSSGQLEDDFPLGPAPDPEIESRIPQAWKEVDRILEITYKSQFTNKAIKFESWKNRPDDDRESVKQVETAYMKWGGLPYAQATRQVPPKEGEQGFESFFKAYQAYIVANQREMRVPRLSPSEMAELDKERKGKSPVFTEQPETVKNGQLMDFQIQGLNFLLNHWWVKSGCILADEMGLGKTAQCICFLAYLNLVQKARPFLIVVPNSLVSNWLREFEKWAPELRTVAYNGDKKSRSIIEEYELFASNGDLKTHVVITTYETFKNEPNTFAKCTRWDCVVIDEGQALKSGEGNKLWTSFSKLRIGMKLLLTGTPLNNTLRELYNLLNFLDPARFADVDDLADPRKELTNERVNAIRDDLRPYMLRRTKDQVLNLPPLGEFVVPVNLTPLQRQLYKGVLEKNSSAILNIVNNTGKAKSKAKVMTTTNVLMTLRKIVCHPYLHIPELDPGNSVPSTEAFRQLTDASAKLLLLESMLPKLREQGHKVLIFSQFKIVLNKLGPFLDGIGTKWLRLDGDTPQLERQRDVDRFNDPTSPCSVFMLSTRAGGVGLTLTAADVVIIFDQDFNPFQDMQAIARAHRIGQKNPVRVFRLVVKHTCEEKILAAGRKKQGLEHIIIQKVDSRSDETEDVASVLQYGAAEILETSDAEAEKASRRYTEAEIDELLSKTAEPLSEAAKQNAGAFATAQVWMSEKGGLGDVDQVGGGEAEGADTQGIWDRAIAREALKEQEKKDQEEAETVGRSRRAKKNVNYVVPIAIVPMTEAQKQKRNAARGRASGTSGNEISSGDEFRDRPRLGGDSSSDDFVPDLDADDRQLLNGDRPPQPRPKRDVPKPPQTSTSTMIANDDEEQAAALERLRKKKLEKRKRAIVPLIAAAKEINNHEVLKELDRAMTTDDAIESTEIIKSATKILDEADRNVPRDRRPLEKRPVPPPPAPVDPTPQATTQKRASESPADDESLQKRPKVSHTADKPAPSSSKPSAKSTTAAATSSMIRSDSKNSAPDATAKKPAFSQSKLSFAAKPAASTSSSTDQRPAPPPVASTSAASSSSSNTNNTQRKNEEIVISDSEED
ncbi:uncharacterized protein JCM6883_004156 [Sporobolomyces salmoneus]|uniref:uncharacterized protein n=1 Tax=Sporobolomyces salmoneus TaxID=183962 RepID=UPI0031788F93